MPVRSPQDVYARHVSSTRGYPLWTPEMSSPLLSYRPEGLRIGDVGVVTPEDGYFDIFFNLCLPKDGDLNRITGVPDGFSPIVLKDGDIQTVPNAESVGEALTMSPVTRVDSGRVPSNGESLTRTERHSFHVASSEGGLLVLPEGAASHDVRDSRPFLEQASRHAATWYHFAEGHRGRIISHDSIYVITGFHKAPSWGAAGWQSEKGSADFAVSLREDESLSTGYRWETLRNMDFRVGSSDDPARPNQAVFIRGFKLALRSDQQGVPQKWVSYQPSPLRARSHSGDSWLSNVWRGISRSIGVSGEEPHQSAARENVGVRIEITSVPEIGPVFHPLDVINRYMLQKEPSAKVAITHDSDWTSLLAKNVLKPEELAQDGLLTRVVSEKYDVIVRDEVALLQSKSNLGSFIDAPTDDTPTTDSANQTPIDGADKPTKVKGANDATHPQSLSVVSESHYRCVEESASVSGASVCRPEGLQSIPGSASDVVSSSSMESLRTIKIIVISDYVCGFCFICDKILRDAIEACRDLPVRFDVELRPFTLADPLSSTSDTNQIVYRNAYLLKRFGKEQTEIKLKAVNELAQKAGLRLAEDSIVCATTRAHRLSTKAYQMGGQALQNKFNTFIFDACLARGANINDEDVLVDAAVQVGLMNKEEATTFLRSTECLDCVEKMVAAAKAQGINGVPFVIIDGKWAVNGLQPVECFIQIFHKLAQLPASQTVSQRTKTEHEIGVH